MRTIITLVSLMLVISSCSLEKGDLQPANSTTIKYSRSSEDPRAVFIVLSNPESAENWKWTVDGIPVMASSTQFSHRFKNGGNHSVRVSDGISSFSTLIPTP